MTVLFQQFRIRVVRPTLQYLGLHSEAAENLLVGTAAQESGLRYLEQVGGGPARGPFEMEPATHGDIRDNFLKYRPQMLDRVDKLLAPWPDPVSQLETNWVYATAMARIKYYRSPEPLPAADDLDGLARMWKMIYNTEQGRGTVEEFVSNYRSLVGE